MSLETDELVIRPLREVVQRGNEAITNAQDAVDGEGSEGHDRTAVGLAKAGQTLRKEGERALNRLQPLWDEQVAKYGDDFKKLIVHNDEFAEKRRKLDSLLYDFEDFVEVDGFDEAKFAELQGTTKALALAVIEVIRTSKVELSQGQTRSTSVFPPLPPLPPLPSPMTSRPDSRSSNAFSVQLNSRSSVKSKDTWPRPPSPNRHRTGLREMYAHTVRGDAAPPLPPMNLHFVAHREKNDAEESVTSIPSPTTPISLSSFPVSEEMLRAELERARIMQTPPMSPRDNHGSAFGHGSHLDRRGEYLPKIIDGPVSPEGTYDNRSSVQDALNAQTRSNRASVLSNTTSLRSSNGQGPVPSALQPASTNRASSTMPTSRTDLSGARTSTSASEPDNHIEKWSTATTTDSHLATSLGYPKWRSVNNNIDPKSKTLCAGAKAFRTGGHWEGVKKIGGVSGSQAQASEYTFGQVYSSTAPVYTDAMAQCKNCEYAHKHSDLSDDFDRDHSANYTAETIRYRRRFLYKSHIPNQTMSKAYYACMFCTLSGLKIHESDATVFATPAQLFAHLARHPQPLPEVTGITVLYGAVSSEHAKASDYDINLTCPPAVNRVPEDARLGFAPVATATKDHFQEQGASKMSQPDRETKALQFFAGARIVGVEFPPKWNGKWCSGWHDGQFGAFPIKTVHLEPPRRKGMAPLQTMESRRSGVTRWKFQPKAGSSAAWLEFDKGDLITNLNWDDSDAWYWTGTNSKGQFGIFPSSHMDVKSIQDGSLETDTSNVSTKKASRTGKSLFRLKRASTAQSLE